MMNNNTNRYVLSREESESGLRIPPKEVFSMSPGGFESDEESSSEESVASRISAWSSGTDKLSTGKKTMDTHGMIEVKLDESKFKKSKPRASICSTRSDGKSVKSTSSSRTPTLRDVSDASFRVQKIRRGKGTPRNSSSTRNWHNAPAPPSESVPDIESHDSKVHDPIISQEELIKRELDPKAQKMNDIASKYLFMDALTEDETMSSMTYRDSKRNTKLWLYCYIATIVAFLFGGFATFAMFHDANQGQSNAVEQGMDESKSPFSLENAIPYIEKMSGAEITRAGTPQNQAYLWIKSKDVIPSGYNSTDQIVQRYILATIFYATKGASAWDHSNDWLTPINECDWDGVSCFTSTLQFTGASSISKIVLPSKGLSGELPKEIGYLKFLRVLNLSNNELIGSIPPSISKLTNLLSLNLEKNVLTGQLPENMDQLIALIQVDLSNNHLKKELPVEIGYIPSLQSIDFSGNDLTGNIPDDYTNLVKLKYFNLENNELNGELPYRLDNLGMLQFFNIARNSIIGTIPDGLGNIETLEELNLQGNLFSGEIPAALGGASSLVKLRLNTNELKGDMPKEICNLQLSELTIDCDEVKCDCCTYCG